MPETSRNSRVSPFVMIVGVALALTWAMASYFSPDKATGPGQDEPVANKPPVLEKEKPYTEPAERSAFSNTQKRPGFTQPRAREILPDGTIVYDLPSVEDVQAERDRADRIKAEVARAKRVTRTREGDVTAKPREVRVSEEHQAYLQELKRTGEYQAVLDQQYQTMLEKLNKGYGPEGGPSREQIEKMYREGTIQF